MTTLKGVEAGRYYTERLPSYYLGSGEPPGLWWGRGARDLALESHIDTDQFLAVMAGRDPGTGEDLGRRFGDDSVRGFDATFSAPKSVSLLWALAEDRIRGEVLEAHDQAVDAVLGWVEDHAHTRLRRNGHVVHVDAKGLIVGVFRQHTSRRLDPQLHTHAVIANRVRAPDGRWLALDARTIKMDQRTLSALYHANLRSELTARLNVEWQQPEHGIAELDGIPDEVLGEFSQRTREIDQRLTRKLERFEESMGRPPSDRERWQLEREAVLDSRPAKPHDTSLKALRLDWWDRTVELGYNPRNLVLEAIGRSRRGLAWNAVALMVDRTLESLGGRQSSWRPAEILRELAAATPTNSTLTSPELTNLLDTLTDRVVQQRCVDLSREIPAGVERRRDGRPVTEPAVDRALTTQPILSEEELIVAWAHRRKTRQPDTARRWVTLADRGLSASQQDATAAVIGNGALELIVGPAGAGKTTALAHAVDILRAQNRAVFGVAPTATAAEVLGAEADMRADTLDKLLHEHTRPDRPPIPEYDLPPDTTLIVDEAGTVSTPKLAALTQLADRKFWRVALVGDPRQFAAVGRGGMFEHLTNSLGAIELDEVRRFTQPWEAEASLQLRAGNPSAIDVYDQHHRIHSGTSIEMEANILDAWTAARERGEIVALMAHTNETVHRLNQACQQQLIDTGQLDTARPPLTVGGQTLYEGDEVVTRLNNRSVQTDQGKMVKNRDHWTIQQIHPDGALTLTGTTGTVTLPAAYAAQHVELGYAQTSYASQGRTVDTALLYADTTTDHPAIYTPLTRGRHSNHAYITTEANQTGPDILTHTITQQWADKPAHTRQAQLQHQQERSLRRPEPTLTRRAGISRLNELEEQARERGSIGLEL